MSDRHEWIDSVLGWKCRYEDGEWLAETLDSAVPRDLEAVLPGIVTREFLRLGARVKELESIVADQAESVTAPESCLWTQLDDESDCWETECGNAFSLNEDGPSQNKMRFCCYCGHQLEEVPWTDKDEETGDVHD
jgi:hypothetical protein